MVDNQIVVVPLKEIDRPVLGGRLAIDPRKIIELAESIREKGLLEPIILRPKNGRFEICAGDRRFLAHEHLGKNGIPSIIKEMTDAEMIVYRGIENLQRENLTPLEEARQYYLMKTEAGLTTDEVCKQTGKHPNTVKRYLRFYNMPDEFKTAVDQGGISLGVAEVLIEIGDPKMRSYYLDMAVKNGITVMVAEMWVGEYNKSIQGALFQEGGGDGGDELVMESKPVYVTCQCCSGPVEVHDARQLIVCINCFGEVRSMKSKRAKN